MSFYKDRHQLQTKRNPVPTSTVGASSQIGQSRKSLRPKKVEVTRRNENSVLLGSNAVEATRPNDALVADAGRLDFHRRRRCYRQRAARYATRIRFLAAAAAAAGGFRLNTAISTAHARQPNCGLVTIGQPRRTGLHLVALG